MPEKALVGKVVHFFPKISVAVVEVLETIRIGDRIVLECGNDLHEQWVESMQIERKDITEAVKGQSIGLKVDCKPSIGSKIFKVLE